jgi:ubiquinone/menaquinone biosynthesis C-methylase UbiE
MANPNETAVKQYYHRKESRWGYRFLLKGTKHYGYYPTGRRAGLSMAQAQRLMEREIGKNLNLPKGAKVLDAGCGEGHVAIHITEDFGYEIYGVDILKESVATANRNRDALNMETPVFAVMDYSETTFPDNYFDGIYTMETGVHSPDYMKTLKEFYRLLKPGGVLVNHEYVLADAIPPEDEKDWEIMYQGAAMMGVFWDWRISRMADIWKSAGFQNVSVRDANKEFAPFMRRLYELAYIPFHILKLLGKEKNYVNIFAGVRSYQLRHEFQYTIIRAQKPQ